MTIGAFHNGSTNLPLKRSDEEGFAIPDASIRAVIEDSGQVVRDQVRAGVLAEELGYDRFALTEHHFQPTGAEFSPNPLMTEAAIAARTERIALLQIANILTWHDPVRFAEQAAVLDHVSEGRAEIGIGRGYQPRENEVLGQYWGGTVQDQEKNRASFEEKLEIIEAAWTEDLLSYRGEFHDLPPSYTKWHHDQDYAYLADGVTDHDVEDMLDWKGSGDEYSDLWNPVVSGGSTLKSFPVLPGPYQSPHPQLWQPVTSERSVEFAARRGINGYLTSGTPELVGRIVDRYYRAAEAAGWPDRRPDHDGEPFRYGWDQRRGRGIGTNKSIFNTDVADEETFERFKLGMEHEWGFYGPFGFAEAVLGEGELPEGGVLDAETLIDRDIVIAGDADHIRDRIAGLYESQGFEHICIDANFETGGLTGEEAEAQMRAFAEDVMPYLREQFPDP